MTHTVHSSNCSMQSGFASFVDFFPIGSSGCDAVPVLCLLGLFTVSRFASRTSNVTTQLAPLRDRWFAVSARASRHCTLQQRGLLLARSGFSSWSSEIRCRCGSCVLLWAVSTLITKAFIAASCHGVVVWFVQHRGAYRSSCVSIVWFLCHFRTLPPFACCQDFSLSRHVLRNVIRTAVSCD